MSPTRTFRTATLAAAIASVAPAAPALAQSQVNVYSYREPQLLEPLMKAFTDATGIKVNFVSASSGLIERIAAEGRNSPADVLLTNDSIWLLQAKDAGVTQPIRSAAIDAAIPSALRDPDGAWVALTRRARVVYASKERVKQDAITFADLADPKWKGRICIRSGQHSYNVAMVAGVIADIGEEKAEAWLRGVKANLARKPSGGDREAARDVYAGLCDLGIGNTYYMGAMETATKTPEQQQWAASIKVLFPDAGRGTPVNVSGAALAANAPNKDNAVKLIEFLASPAAQTIYAEVNHEYPVVAGVEASQRVKAWGTLKPDGRPIAEVARLRRKASELVDKVGFDAGPAS